MKNQKFSIFIAASLLTLLAACFLVMSATVMAPHPRQFEMKKAAELMIRYTAAIAEQRGGIDLALDPNKTGLIGLENSPLTTTAGDLTSKRTSLNPDFAALVVRQFNELGIAKGDRVAIGASGSFPGILLAVLAACSTLDVEPVMILSIGASQFGANIPGFSTVEIIKILKAKGLPVAEPVAVSPGGEHDSGLGGLYVEGPVDDLVRLAHGAGYPVIETPSLAANIRTRFDLYTERGPVKAFINIGGADANFGTISETLTLGNGIVKNHRVKTSSPERGLVLEFLDRGVPVINFLNIKGLAQKSGIPLDPVPFPPPGSSEVYFVTAPSKPIAALGLAAAAVFLVLAKLTLPGKSREKTLPAKG